MKTRTVGILFVLLALVSTFACTKTTINEGNTYIFISSPDATSPTQMPDAGLAGRDTVAVSQNDTATIEAAASPDAQPLPMDTGFADATEIKIDATPVVVVQDSGATPDVLSVGANDAQASDLLPATTPLMILSVEVAKLDSLGNPAEDVRTFTVRFNGPAINIWISIYETVSGANFLWTPVMADASATEALEISPGSWTAKLKPNTSYTWKITASSPDGKQTATMTDTFTTSLCFPGDTRACYSGPANTNGVGRCHGSRQACIPTNGGPQWDGNCIGEVTPYKYGDRCGDGVDEDCDGKVDNSIQMQVPAGQDDIWSLAGTDGEVLRFDMDGTNSSATNFYWIDVQVERHGLYAGYYHFFVMDVSGAWADISNDVHFFDSTSGGYLEGMQDLGKNLYTGPSQTFPLGIQWKDSNGLVLGAGLKYHFMLVASVSPEVYGKGGTIRHYGPHSESACDTSGGKTITMQ